MSESTECGSVIERQGLLQSGTNINLNTRVHASKLTGYRTYVTEPEVSESSWARNNSQQANRQLTRVTPAQRYALTGYLKNALGSCERMIEASRSNDVLDLANAGLELKGDLRELWNLRSLRNRNWGKTLNFLQSALAKCIFENFTLQQCQALKETLLVEMDMPQPVKDDVRMVLQRLKKVGLDPWTGLSMASNKISK